MKLLNAIATKLADRITAGRTTALTDAGLTVTRQPNGRIEIHHPAIPELARARRARLLTNPDAIDLALADEATLVLARTEALERKQQRQRHPANR